MAKPKYIEVSAGVRYWEDGTLNGEEDGVGIMPFREGDMWRPVIDLDEGKVVDWPKGDTASIHYKVCDSGEYWLLDEEHKRVAKWNGCYVPDDLLCVGAKGYGDYIIFSIEEDGKITGWSKPNIMVNGTINSFDGDNSWLVIDPIVSISKCPVFYGDE